MIRFMGKDKNEFQDLSEKILKPNEHLRKDVLNEFDDFVSSVNVLDDANKIDEPTLLSLIGKSRKSECICEFIAEMLPLLEPECITDRVFNACICYSDIEFQKTLCVQLAHMWLRIEQLMILNELLDTPEAFIKIVCIMVRERCSEDELEVFLKRNKRFRDALPCCIAWLMPEYENSTLMKVIERHANQNANNH